MDFKIRHSLRLGIFGHTDLAVGFGWSALVVSAAMCASVHLENQRKIKTLAAIALANQNELAVTQITLRQQLTTLAAERAHLEEVEGQLGDLRRHDQATIDQLRLLQKDSAAKP